jgi:hypothetical protein
MTWKPRRSFFFGKHYTVPKQQMPCSANSNRRRERAERQWILDTQRPGKSSAERMQCHALFLMDIIINPEASFRGRGIWPPSRPQSPEPSQSPSLRRRPMLRPPSRSRGNAAAATKSFQVPRDHPSLRTGFCERAGTCHSSRSLGALSHGHWPGSGTAAATAGEVGRQLRRLRWTAANPAMRRPPPHRDSSRVAAVAASRRSRQLGLSHQRMPHLAAVAQRLPRPQSLFTGQPVHPVRIAGFDSQPIGCAAERILCVTENCVALSRAQPTGSVRAATF